mgnify:CR=1 FL=1
MTNRRKEIKRYDGFLFMSTLFLSKVVTFYRILSLKSFLRGKQRDIFKVHCGFFKGIFPWNVSNIPDEIIYLTEYQ